MVVKLPACHLHGAKPKDTKISFEQSLNEFLDKYKDRVNQQTYKGQLWRFGLLLDAAKRARIDQIPIAYFGRPQVEDLIISMKASPLIKNPTREGYVMELKALGKFFNWWHDARDLEFINPINKHHKAMVRGPKKQKGPSYIKPEDFLIWLDYVKENNINKVWYYLFSTMFRLGLRPGECAGLYWTDFNFAKNEVHIQRKVRWDEVTAAPEIENFLKTESSQRIMSFSSELALDLKEWKLLSESSELVFQSPQGGLIKQGSYLAVANRSFKRLGMPYKTAKILRHTHCTLGLLANGGNISELQHRLRHTNRKTTETYAHPEIMEKSELPQLIENVIPR